MGQKHLSYGSGEGIKGKAEYTYYSTWTCCACTGNGGSGAASGMSVKLNPSCYECGHVTCSDCPTQTHKQRIVKDVPQINENTSHAEQIEVGGIGERLKKTLKLKKEKTSYANLKGFTKDIKKTAFKISGSESETKETRGAKSVPTQEATTGEEAEDCEMYLNALDQRVSETEESEIRLEVPDHRDNSSKLAPMYSEKGIEVDGTKHETTDRIDTWRHESSEGSVADVVADAGTQIMIKAEDCDNSWSLEPPKQENKEKNAIVSGNSALNQPQENSNTSFSSTKGSTKGNKRITVGDEVDSGSKPPEDSPATVIDPLIAVPGYIKVYFDDGAAVTKPNWEAYKNSLATLTEEVVDDMHGESSENEVLGEKDLTTSFPTTNREAFMDWGTRSTAKISGKEPGDLMVTKGPLEGEFLDLSYATSNRTAGKSKQVPLDISDHESEISNDADSTFSFSDSISSRSSLGQAIGASDELISLLATHDELKPLLEKASQLLDDSTFKENFAKLLRKFSVDLNKEAAKATEVLAVNLVRHSRRKVAHGIWRNFYSISCGKSIAGALDHNRLDKARKLDETLKRLNQSEGNGIPDVSQGTIEESDSSGDDEALHRLPNLEQVKTFLVTGLAFQKLLKRFKQLLETKSERLDMINEDEEDVPAKLLEETSVGEIVSSTREQETAEPEPENQSTSIGRILNRKWAKIYLHIDRLFRPNVALGYRRLEWETECGTWLYDDYENSDPAHLEQFYQELISSEEFDGTDQTPQGGAPNPLGPPSMTSSSTTSSIASTQCSLSTNSSAYTSVSNGPSAPIPLTPPSTPLPVTPLTRKFFAICVNTGSNLTTLGEIDVSGIDHDGEWFSKMWAEYDRLRGFRNQFFRRIFIRPVDVKYVQFTVEEHQRADISFDPATPIIPPPDEVAARNYDYTPCPLKSRPSPETFLHYRSCISCIASRKKKKHSSRLPKKLSRSMLDVYLRAGPDEDVLGWGVLIVEGPNKGAITLLSAAMLTLSVVVAVLYTVFAKDASSGFTIGSFVVAVWVSWMTAFYYHAKET